MRFLYTIGIHLYGFVAIIASLFSEKARFFVNGRKKWYKNLQNNFVSGDSKVIWMHVSSLGEFEQGRPLLERIKSELQDFKIVLTFFSPSGYEIRKNYAQADYVCYLPLDTPGNAKRFLKYVKPSYSVFVKYDFWFNYILQAKKLGSNIILISGLFRDKQMFFKSFGTWYMKQLQNFNHLFLQDEQSEKLLHSIQIKNTTVCGDSRMDRVIEIARQKKDFELIEKFSTESFIIVCGSTWPPDENLLFEYLQKSQHSFKLIIAPHDISESHLKGIEEHAPEKCLRYSKANDENIQETKILVIDSIGMLSSLYHYGKIAYIGGGFGVSIHNTLEPAVYGIPVIFGPKYQKFKEAVDMIASEGAFTISSYQELENILNRLLSNFNLLNQSGDNAKDYIYKMSGATGTIFDYIAMHL